jgi:SAM-dependent methyltransferase|tara:strand:+ start:1190 stop:1816 length:627 start_codon:yes stop_codon:yes gene_type:complete
MKHTPRYLKPYQEAVDVFGGTFEATLWRSKQGQSLRFNEFTNEIDFSGTSILDVGCGIGDFASFLHECSIEFNSFRGIDAMDAMIQTAQDRQLQRCTFEVSDVLDDLDSLQHEDWIVFSGTLNTMTQERAMELILRAFDTCTLGVAFNFLSNQSWRNPKNEDLTPASRFDTLEFLRFAFSLTPLVSFNQMYLQGHDATIILRKKEVSQ